MRVLCIDDEWTTGHATPPKWQPVKGEIYNVVGETSCNCGCGMEGWELQDFPEHWWSKRHFVELGDMTFYDLMFEIGELELVTK